MYIHLWEWEIQAIFWEFLVYFFIYRVVDGPIKFRASPCPYGNNYTAVGK